ncbi:type IV pilus assembly protein PilM [Thermoanaerobacter kivui]|uniref:Type IV pilus assembly protein PilM n=1 Tax=Thermoanaerobacter kivui TaxID=2325 RepID=A0A097ARC3_THEKI|nr:type IV pilus assembly protein PilM [Thermoanaerobacter kivui]AIS52357.1 type IV pilus assembly protein PilM [Thermoanaerobacter kivui]
MLGIEIGNFNTKLVVGDKKNKFFGKKLMVKTPSNVVINGKIIDVNTLSEVIRETLKKNDIKEKKVCFAISSPSNIIRDLKFPQMKEEEVKNALSYEIEQYIPDPENYVVDYKYLGNALEDDKSIRVMIAASPKEITEKYVKLADILKLRLEAIDIYSNCIYKAYKRTNLDAGIVAIVDIGSNLTDVTIIDNGIYIFSRTMEFGGNEITQTIANAFNVDFEMAEEYKRTKNLIGEESYKEAEENIVLFLSDMFQQIGRIFDFYYATYHKSIQKILMIGGTSRLLGLKEYVESHFRIPVLVPEEEDYIYFLPAYGCLLRGE